MEHIRNFCIIAHIDHGKSTLADRMLEVTGTIEARKMKAQVLDSMDLERERGITIKMQPVRMSYTTEGNTYVLNLIDTPGHIDFAYEVSRALSAVEGAVLLVDSTQGVQAQTLTTLAMARDLGLTIIPAITKVDSSLARPDEVAEEIAMLLGIDPSVVHRVSGKTGEGVKDLLSSIVREVPPPTPWEDAKGEFSALIFDFTYSNHRGVVVHARIMSGEVAERQGLAFRAARSEFQAAEVGVFMPEEKQTGTLRAGEIGYIVTGIKEPGIASVGDTIVKAKSVTPALSGYREPSPVVWASIFPESQDDFDILRQALQRLHLSDSSLTYEEESSGTLGRGFRCGFLGMLHLEIITERLRREFNLELVVTTPSITYEVVLNNGEREKIYSPAHFPDHGAAKEIYEPWVRVRIIAPNDYTGTVMKILFEHEAITGETETFSDGRIALSAEMPLRELMRGFFDKLKSVSSGYASISYEMLGLRPADVVRLDILVADEPITAFARVVSRVRLQEEAERVVERLEKVLPRQLFVAKIQGKALGRIIASRTLKAMRKDVTGYLYGGDVTRKKKLLEKQKKGKKKMRERGKVNIPQDVFMKMVQE